MREYFAVETEYTIKDIEYEIVDEPYLGYNVHLCKLSAGWRPLFQRHKTISTFKEVEEFCLKNKSMVSIYDEYGRRYTWKQYFKKVYNHSQRKAEPRKWIYDIDPIFPDNGPRLHMASCTEQEAEIYIGAAAISREDKQLHPTAAGMLMFGDEFNIVRHFPEYFLDYREMLDPTIRWTDRLQSSSGEWSGNICDFYFRVYNKIIKDIKVPFKTSGGDRIDDTPVHEALREALANCLINTDYYGVRGVVIKKEPDKLILENPGYIRTGKEQMRKGGESDPRNKALMKMFNLINIGERAGSGVPNIFNVWEDEGWIEPVIEEKFDPDRTILTLEFKKKSGDKKATKKSDDKKATKKSDGKKVTKKTQAQYDKILDFMEFDKEYSLQEFCELLDLKETRTKAILKQLNEYIEPIGSTKNRKYLRKK